MRVYPPPTWAQFWRYTLGGVVAYVLLAEWLWSGHAPLVVLVAPIVLFVAVHALVWWDIRRGAWRWVERALRGDQ